MRSTVPKVASIQRWGKGERLYRPETSDGLNKAWGAKNLACCAIYRGRPVGVEDFPLVHAMTYLRYAFILA